VKIQVIINGVIAYEEPVNSYAVDNIIDLVSAQYNVALLQKCGVEAYVIVEVGSLMNRPGFKPAPEAYDALYFDDIMI
jgi:hypothetical protein